MLFQLITALSAKGELQGLKFNPQIRVCCLEPAMGSSVMGGCKDALWEVKEDIAIAWVAADLVLSSICSDLQEVGSLIYEVGITLFIKNLQIKTTAANQINPLLLVNCLLGKLPLSLKQVLIIKDDVGTNVCCI